MHDLDSLLPNVAGQPVLSGQRLGISKTPHVVIDDRNARGIDLFAQLTPSVQAAVMESEPRRIERKAKVDELSLCTARGEHSDKLHQLGSLPGGCIHGLFGQRTRSASFLVAPRARATFRWMKPMRP